MNSRRLWTWVCVAATLAVAAVGTINIIRLRIQGDAVGRARSSTASSAAATRASTRSS